MPDENTPQRRTSTRRSVAAGAGWAVPTVLIATAAPAYTASVECAPQSAEAVSNAWAFNGSIANWTPWRSSIFAPRVVYDDDYNGLESVALVEVDPPTFATTTTLTSTTVCLAAGSYSMIFDARLFNNNPRDCTLRSEVRSTDSDAVLAFDEFTTARTGDVTKKTVTLRFTIPARTQVRFIYTWSFAAGSLFSTGDDIGATAPTVVKTA